MSVHIDDSIFWTSKRPGRIGIGMLEITVGTMYCCIHFLGNRRGRQRVAWRHGSNTVPAMVVPVFIFFVICDVSPKSQSPSHQKWVRGCQRVRPEEVRTGAGGEPGASSSRGRLMDDGIWGGPCCHVWKQEWNLWKLWSFNDGRHGRFGRVHGVDCVLIPVLCHNNLKLKPAGLGGNEDSCVDPLVSPLFFSSFDFRRGPVSPFYYVTPARERTLTQPYLAVTASSDLCAKIRRKVPQKAFRVAIESKGRFPGSKDCGVVVNSVTSRTRLLT